MNVNERTDSQLIEQVREGDLEALGELYDRYRLRVYRTALAITRDTAAAEDILQDCFLRLHRHADRIDLTLPLTPWLYRVTVNLAYTWITRRQKRRAPLELVLDWLAAPGALNPEPLTERREVQDAVRRAIDSLSFAQRVVIILYYMDGQSVREIAQILGCPEGTVKSRLYYARENLKEKLGAVDWLYEMAHERL